MEPFPLFKPHPLRLTADELGLIWVEQLGDLGNDKRECPLPSSPSGYRIGLFPIRVCVLLQMLPGE